MEDRIIGEFDKSGNLIRIQFRTYKNEQYLDIREFYEDDEGEWKPTKKGLCLHLELLPEFFAAVEAARKQVQPTDASTPADDSPKSSPGLWFP